MVFFQRTKPTKFALDVGIAAWTNQMRIRHMKSNASRNYASARKRKQQQSKLRQRMESTRSALQRPRNQFHADSAIAFNSAAPALATLVVHAPSNARSQTVRPMERMTREPAHVQSARVPVILLTRAMLRSKSRFARCWMLAVTFNRRKRTFKKADLCWQVF